MASVEVHEYNLKSWSNLTNFTQLNYTFNPNGSRKETVHTQLVTTSVFIGLTLVTNIPVIIAILTKAKNWKEPFFWHVFSVCLACLGVSVANLSFKLEHLSMRHWHLSFGSCQTLIFLTFIRTPVIALTVAFFCIHQMIILWEASHVTRSKLIQILTRILPIVPWLIVCGAYVPGLLTLKYDRLDSHLIHFVDCRQSIDEGDYSKMIYTIQLLPLLILFTVFVSLVFLLVRYLFCDKYGVSQLPYVRTSRNRMSFYSVLYIGGAVVLLASPWLTVRLLFHFYCVYEIRCIIEHKLIVLYPYVNLLNESLTFIIPLGCLLIYDVRQQFTLFGQWLGKKESEQYIDNITTDQELCNSAVTNM